MQLQMVLMLSEVESCAAYPIDCWLAYRSMICRIRSVEQLHPNSCVLYYVLSPLFITLHSLSLFNDASRQVLLCNQHFTDCCGYHRWVQDADLWTWQLPDSKAFHAGLSAQNLDYNALDNPGIWQQLQQLDVQKVLADGRVVLQRQEQLVSSAVARSTMYQLGGAQGLTSGWGCCLGSRIQVKYELHTISKQCSCHGMVGLSRLPFPAVNAQAHLCSPSTGTYTTFAVAELGQLLVLK